ncbi:MAG: hypothetical protein C0507_01490 [Cyanobacteria bacterium PR.3.49]|nr:hypothetical protein [Cyanobacteria bacterium PR.3.49]
MTEQQPARKKPEEPPVDENVNKPLDAGNNSDADSEETFRDADDELAEAADPPEAKLERISNPEALDRNDYLQRTLIELNSIFNEFKPTGPAEKRQEEFSAWVAGLQQQQRALQAERDKGVFGPETAKAYKQYRDWLEQAAVPNTVRTMDSYQLALPPGCPLKLPLDQQQRALTPELYKAMASAGQHKLDLGLTTDRVPTDEELERLDNTFAWLGQCHDSIKSAHNRFRDDFLIGQIEKYNLPEKWLNGREIDPDAWRSSASEMVDLSMRTRNYVEAMQSLFKDSYYRDFPLQFPPGTSITVNVDGKRQTLTDQDLIDPSTRSLLGRAKIESIKLDLPEDLRQENPANKQKIERLRQWLDKYGAEIDQAMVEYFKVESNPDAIMMYGDQEWNGGWKGRFNANDEFLGMAGPGQPPGPGETLKEVNLTGYDFTTETLPNGNIRITQTIQAEHAPIYAYQNIRAFGVQNVGKKMPVDVKEYGPEDWVPIRDGDKVRMVKAKNADEARATQKAWYVGEKVAIAGGDLLTALPPTMALGAMALTARTAAVAGQVALKLTAKQVAWELTKNVARVGIGVAGIFNNAGARDTSWGGAVNTARGIYFLADISAGLAGSGLRWARGGAKVAQEMSGAEKLHTLIHGRKAAEGVEALAGIPYLKQAHTAANYGFMAVEASFAPILYNEFSHGIDQIANGHRDHLRDAKMQIGDGRGLQQAEKNSFDPSVKRNLEGAHQLLDNWAETLMDGRKPETQAKLQEIFASTKRLMGPLATDEQRAQYRQELLRNTTFTGAEIQRIENTYAEQINSSTYQLSDQQVHDLMDPLKRREFPKTVREMAEKILSEKDADVVAASHLALLYLSRDKDGSISEQLAKAPIKVEQYSRAHEVYNDHGSTTTWVTMRARDVEAHMSAAESVESLKRDLESKTLGNRGIVTGDALVRIGALTHQQYGGVLQDVLSSPTSSKSDKMRALTDPMSSRFAAIVDGIRHQETGLDGEPSSEAKDRSLGKSFGLSSQNILRTLEETAKGDADPDVRAMAAALVHGLREKEASDRGALLTTYNQAWQAMKNQPAGTFAAQITAHLKTAADLKVDEGAPDKELQRGRKMNAALSLAMMANPDDKATQVAISRAIADCFSAENFTMNLQVMQELIPARMKELTQHDPETANRLRQKAIDFLRVPDSVDQMPQMTGIMQRMKSLVYDSAESDTKSRAAFVQQLATKYKDMLDPSRPRDYAQYSPDIRAAAIQGLAELGARDPNTLALMHRYITAAPTYSLSGKTVEAGEQDARVRSAAVYALQRLNDAEFKSAILDLIDRETDPQVAQQLKDVEFNTRRIEPDSREYKQMFEETLKELIDPASTAKYSYLKDWGDAKTLEWLGANFPNMQIDDFMRATNAKAQGTLPITRFWSHKETEAYEEYKIISKASDARWAQWQSLTELARGDGEEANKAKMALAYILNHPDYMGEPGLTLKFEGDKFKQGVADSWRRQYNHDYAEMAARALTECAAPGSGGRDLTAHIIRMGLNYQQNMTPQVSYELLKGWKRLAERSDKLDAADERMFKQQLFEQWKKLGKVQGQPNSNQEQRLQTELYDRWRALSTRTDKLNAEEEQLRSLGSTFKPPLFAMTRERVANVTAKALEIELLRNPGNQCEWYQQELIEQLKQQQHRMVFPVIEALAKSSNFPGVRADAERMLADLRDSVSLMWRNTTPDLRTPSEDRAQALKKALQITQSGDKQTGKNIETTVQEIFNATAGLDLKPGDPCLNYLSLAMNEQAERVRLAAAMVVAQSKLDASNPEKQKAIGVLQQLAANGSKAGYKKDAAELLVALRAAAAR